MGALSERGVLLIKLIFALSRCGSFVEFNRLSSKTIPS